MEYGIVFFVFFVFLSPNLGSELRISDIYKMYMYCKCVHMKNVDCKCVHTKMLISNEAQISRFTLCFVSAYIRKMRIVSAYIPKNVDFERSSDQPIHIVFSLIADSGSR